MCGCNSNETIKHLFLDCLYARMIWKIIFYTTSLTPPRSIGHMFDSWLSNQSKKIRNLIWVEVAVVCWAIWRCRNDIIFNKFKVNSILQVIFRGTYWLRFWAQLQRDEHAKNALSEMSRNIEIICYGASKRRVEAKLSFAVVLCLNWRLVVLFFLCKLYNNWLCTSTDVQARFVIFFLKKYVCIFNS